MRGSWYPYPRSCRPCTASASASWCSCWRTAGAGLHHNDLYTLYVDRDGALWSSAYQHGVYRRHNSRFTLFNTTDRPDLIGIFGLQAMLQDRRGRY
jgi:hypothetical protein